MLKVVHDAEESNEPAGASLLDELVRDAARQMIAVALQAEVAAYIDSAADQLDEAGRRLVVRNGGSDSLSWPHRDGLGWPHLVGVSGGVTV